MEKQLTTPWHQPLYVVKKKLDENKIYAHLLNEELIDESTEPRSWFRSKLLDTLIVFLKEFFEKQSQQTTTNACKIIPLWYSIPWSANKSIINT